MPSGTKKTSGKGRTIRRRKKPAPPAPGPELVSPGAFGKLIGASRQAVDKAIRDGRLSRSVTREKRGKVTYTRINAEVARKEWASNTAPRLETGAPTVTLDAEAIGPSPAAGGGGDPGELEEHDYARERARKEKFLADKHAIDVARRSAQLVDLQDVIRSCVALGRTVRDGLADASLTLPGDLVRMKTAKEIQIALERHAVDVAAALDAQVAALVEQLEGEAA